MSGLSTTQTESSGRRESDSPTFTYLRAELLAIFRHGVQTLYTGVAVTVSFSTLTSLRLNSHLMAAWAELFEIPTLSATSW